MAARKPSARSKNSDYGKDITPSDYIAAYKQIWGDEDPSPDAESGLIEHEIRAPFKKGNDVQCVYFNLYVNMPNGPKRKQWLSLKASHIKLFSSAKYPPKFDTTDGKIPKYMAFSIQGPKLDDEDNDDEIEQEQRLLCEAVDLIVKELNLRVAPRIIENLKTYNQDKAVIKFTNLIVNNGLKVHVPIQDQASDEDGTKHKLDKKLYRFRIPVCKDNGLIGIKNNKTNEFKEIIFNNRLMKQRMQKAAAEGRPAVLEKIAATLKSNGKIVKLHYSNIKNVVTSGSEAVVFISFNGNSFSSQGLSFACSINEMYITTKPYVPAGPKISVEELDRTSRIEGPAEIEIDMPEEENGRHGNIMAVEDDNSMSKSKSKSSKNVISNMSKLSIEYDSDNDGKQPAAAAKHTKAEEEVSVSEDEDNSTLEEHANKNVISDASDNEEDKPKKAKESTRKPTVADAVKLVNTEAKPKPKRAAASTRGKK